MQDTHVEILFAAPDVSPLAVLIAGLSGFVVGGIWYGPLFSKPWMAANNFVLEDLKRDFSPVRAYGTAAVCSIIAAYALAMITAPDMPVPAAATQGAIIGLVWVATSFATSYAFERRSNTLLAINAGYHIVEFAVMGAIIALMQ